MSVVNPDLSLTIGIVLAVFALPSIVSAMTDGRSPRVPALLVVVAGLLVIYALRSKPGGYTLQQVPETMIRVLSAIIA